MIIANRTFRTKVSAFFAHIDPAIPWGGFIESLYLLDTPEVKGLLQSQVWFIQNYARPLRDQTFFGDMSSKVFW